jgi:hypothetical protein
VGFWRGERRCSFSCSASKIINRLFQDIALGFLYRAIVATEISGTRLDIDWPSGPSVVVGSTARHVPRPLKCKPKTSSWLEEDFRFGWYLAKVTLNMDLSGDRVNSFFTLRGMNCTCFFSISSFYFLLSILSVFSKGYEQV